MESELTEIFEWITRCLVVTLNTINICIVVHHTITPGLHSGHVKMASVTSVRGADHMMDGNISPLFSPAFHSFENIAHCYEERDGVRLLWVYSAEESKHCRLERSDNNSQSVISLTLPPGPWLLAIPAWSPWLSLSLSSHDLYQAQTEKYLSISPPH